MIHFTYSTSSFIPLLYAVDVWSTLPSSTYLDLYKEWEKLRKITLCKTKTLTLSMIDKAFEIFVRFSSINKIGSIFSNSRYTPFGSQMTFSLFKALCKNIIENIWNKHNFNMLNLRLRLLFDWQSMAGLTKLKEKLISIRNLEIYMIVKVILTRSIILIYLTSTIFCNLEK